MTAPSSPRLAPQSSLPHPSVASTRCFRLLLAAVGLGLLTVVLSLDLLWRDPYLKSMTLTPLLSSPHSPHWDGLQQPAAVDQLSESSLVLLTFVSACKNGVSTLLPILRSIEQWAAHTRLVLPEATLVVALPRLGWQAYVDSLAPDEQTACAVHRLVGSSADMPVPLTVGVPLHALSSSAPLCPLGVHLLLFLDDMPRANLSTEERLGDGRHAWFPDGCYELWRDRIVAIQLMQQLSAHHRVVVSLDPDAYICPGPGKARLMEHLQALASGEQDSVSTLAPIPLGNGKVPYLPDTAVERNCGVLGFASHNRSRDLTQAWHDCLHKQLLCEDCNLRGDQSAYREAVYEHYERQQGHPREHIVGEADFCRWKGTCASGCLIVHRHDSERGYTGNASMPNQPTW